MHAQNQTKANKEVLDPELQSRRKAAEAAATASFEALIAEDLRDINRAWNRYLLKQRQEREKDDDAFNKSMGIKREREHANQLELNL